MGAERRFDRLEMIKKVISRMECKYFMNLGMGLTEKSVPGNSIDRPARAKVRFFS